MNEADKRRIEDNYFIKLGRQISGDPYLEPQLAMQLGRERFAGFKGMPLDQGQFDPLKGNIASVSEDVPMDFQIPENIDEEYDKLIASGMEEFGDVAYDPNMPNPLRPNIEIPDYPRPNLEIPDTTIAEEITKKEPIFASKGIIDPKEDFAMNPSRNDVLTSPAMTAQNQALAQSSRGIDVDSQGNLIPFTEPSSASPYSGDPALYYDTPRPSMTAKADDWYDSFSKNFNKDASSDAFLLGSQLINTYDKDPLLGRDVGGGSLAGITQGGLTGAGMGSQFGPKGALIGAGIGATAGLLGGFDRSSPEPYTETKIIRGAGMAFPQMQSSNYYQGLI